MHGLWASIGPNARDRSLSWNVAGEVQEVSAEGIRAQRRSPSGQPLPEWQGSSRSGRVRVFMDGDLTVRGVPVARGLGAHISAFAETVDSRGVNAALGSLQGGSFNGIVLVGPDQAFLLRDPMASIPIYEARAGSDWLLSSSPLSLARAAGVDNAPDRIGLASWALVGYSIGERHLVRGVRIVKPAILRVRDASGIVTSRPLPINVFTQAEVTGQGASVDELAEAFKAGCKRLASRHVPTAHLQSGGMDSRLILAAWPEDEAVTCYGYGDPESGEVAIARDVARLRGSPYHHVLHHGDDVARSLEDMFEANGLIVYPARWLLAERIAADGHLHVLDGFAGGFVLGGHFYSPQRKLANLFHKIRARFRDARISELGLEHLATEVYDGILELKQPASLNGFIDQSFVRELESRRADVIADIHDELERLRPGNDSVALLVRNFTIANRSAHAIVQQGAMSRRMLSAEYPFVTDYDFLNMALTVPPERLAYRRLYIEIFRRHFPRYAALPYASSMVPVRRSASAHQLSGLLIRRGIRIPGLTGPLTRSPNNWARWLRESAALRETLGASLRAGGIAGRDLQQNLDALGRGARSGSGKLMHLATIGRWLALSGRG